MEINHQKVILPLELTRLEYKNKKYGYYSIIDTTKITCDFQTSNLFFKSINNGKVLCSRIRALSGEAVNGFLSHSKIVSTPVFTGWVGGMRLLLEFRLSDALASTTLEWRESEQQTKLWENGDWYFDCD